MKKIIVILLVLILTFFASACGGSGASYDEAKTAEEGSYDGFADLAPEAEYGGDMASESMAMAEDSSEPQDSISIGLPGSIDKDSVKIIYTANMSVQTLDFDEAVKGLSDLTEKFGGYFESASVDNGEYYSDETYKYGSYTVRVPSEKYQEFLNSVNEGLHVVNLSQNSEDIGQVYFETERRVETLKNKHDRLEELLKKADKMKDIIELETALSDTEYEIEQYTSELKRYDSLVSYSTVYITIEQVSQYSTGIQEDLSFGQRLLRSIKSGAEEFGWGIGDLINWIGYHVIQILILTVLVIAAVKLHLVRRIRSAFGRKPHDKGSDNKKTSEG